MNKNKRLFFVFLFVVSISFVLSFIQNNQEIRKSATENKLKHILTSIYQSRNFSVVDANISPSGDIYVVFAGTDWSSNNINLSLIRCYDNKCSEGEIINLIENRGNSIHKPKILFDDKGIPFFVYNDAGILKMFKCKDKNCDQKTDTIVLFDSFFVDSFKVIGASNNLPIISWYSGDGKSDKLFYSYCGDWTCSDFNKNTIELVTIGDYMSIPDIVFDNNKTSLVYWNSNINKLVLIKCSDITCKSKTTLNIADLSDSFNPLFFIKNGKYYYSLSGNLFVCSDLNCSSISKKVIGDDVGYVFDSNFISDGFLVAHSSGNYLDINSCDDLNCSNIKKNKGINDAGWGSVVGKDIEYIKVFENRNNQANVVFGDTYGNFYLLKCVDKWCSGDYEVEEFSFWEEERPEIKKCNVCQLGDKTKGDANCDGKITMVDFEIWRNEYFDIKDDNYDWKANFSCTDELKKPSMVDFNIWRKSYFGV
jgi:hypothetical protein